MTANQRIQLLFFSFSKSPLNDQSFHVDQRAQRSHRGEYVRCYFSESAIFLLIRWNKHIISEEFQSAGYCFCNHVEISFVPKHYKENQSLLTSMILLSWTKRHNNVRVFTVCACNVCGISISTRRVWVRYSYIQHLRDKEGDAEWIEIKASKADQLILTRMTTWLWSGAKTVGRYQVKRQIERKQERQTEMCQ